MPDCQELFFAAIQSQLDFLRGEAKVMGRSRQVKHCEALNLVANSLECRDWQHLVYECEKASLARINREIRELDDLASKHLFEMNLRELCHEHPAIAQFAIEDLAVDLCRELFLTCRSPSLFLQRGEDFGDNFPMLNDKHCRGWRLCIDRPLGSIFFGHYPARGKLVAVIDASVPGDVIYEHMKDDPGLDEGQAVMKAKKSYREFCSIVFFEGGVVRNGEYHRFAEACYGAISELIESECEIFQKTS